MLTSFFPRCLFLRCWQALLLAICLLPALNVRAQSTTFSWQGRLLENDTEANGEFDFVFWLYGAETGQYPLGSNAFPATVISNGLYAVTLDFGLDVFDGSPRWLEICVRGKGADDFTCLQPRQPVLTTPYALRARVAETVSGGLPIEQLPTTVALLDATNVFTAPLAAPLFSGDGSGLTNIPTAAVSNLYSVLNVRSLGAVGDGEADDTAAIQAAIDLTVQPGMSGEVFFPPGRYRITDTLRISPNTFSSEQVPTVGPTRLVGSGMGASVLAFYVTNQIGVDFRSSVNGRPVTHFEIARLTVEGPLARGWNAQDRSQGIVGGYPPDPHWPYQGIKFKLRDAAVVGWERALAATNVWDVVIDSSELLSNRLHGIAFSCVHSTLITSTRVAGQAAPGRLTGTGIGFYGPDSDSLAYGDTAMILNSRVDYCTNAIYNDELALEESGGNHQFCGKYMVTPSKWRPSDGNVWRPYNVVINTMYCESTQPWVTNGPAQIEMDSFSAEQFIWINPVGNVCLTASAYRPLVNVLGTTNGGSSYTNFVSPYAFGGRIPNTIIFNGGTNQTPLIPFRPTQPVMNGPILATNNNPSSTALTLLQGGNGNGGGSALAIGGNVNRSALTAATNKIGAITGYSFANGNPSQPDVALLGYVANDNFSHMTLGGIAGDPTVARAAQSVQFVTSDNTGVKGAIRGGFGYRGGLTVGDNMDWRLTNGTLSAQAGMVSYRTNAWTTALLGNRGFGLWNSNGTIYCSVNVNGVITNKVMIP